MQILFIMGGGLFLTWWFLQGLLNPFIHAVLAILKTALVAILTLFFNVINSLSNVIYAKITKPVRKVTRRIHLPDLAKASIYLLIGAVVFYVDQLYGKRLFEVNETIPFYPIGIMDKSYWVSGYAFWTGGFSLFLASWNILKVILGSLNLLLDHPMRISIVVQK